MHSCDVSPFHSVNFCKVLRPFPKLSQTVLRAKVISLATILDRVGRAADLDFHSAYWIARDGLQIRSIFIGRSFTRLVRVMHAMSAASTARMCATTKSHH